MTVTPIWSKCQLILVTIFKCQRPCSFSNANVKLVMLFHNRPVKAAMGSVIVNGGVQLSGGKSLVNTKLATLHFGAE